MALARLITFTPLTLIKSADVNGEFNNILNNPIALLSPTTGPINFNLQLHTNLLPSAITASSASQGQAIIATSSGGAVFSSPSDSYKVTGLLANNTPATPNSKFDFSADVVVLRNPTTGVLNVQTATGTQTNDTAVAGSTAGGRDQAGVFSASSWIHFYFIWNGTTLSTLSSAVAPPTGPTLPTGYTHWAYAGAVFFTAGSILTKTRMRGSKAFFEAIQPALSGGSATVETAVGLTAFIPPNALSYRAFVTFINVTNAASNTALRIVTGVAYLTISQTVAVANSGVSTVASVDLPNLGQNLFYINSGAGDSTTINIQGYSMPNGGE